MALVDLDSWQTEIESCNRLSNTLLNQLTQRENKLHASSEYNRYTSAIQVGLKQFDRELQQLKFKLNDAAKTKTITFEETERRQQQLDILQTQFQQLHRKYTDSARTDRQSLLKNPNSSNNRQTPTSKTNAAGTVEEDSDSAPIIDAHNVQALKQQHIDLIEQQNRGLETLSQTISRQRQLATQLGQEVEDQNEILDNLANTIERVETGVTSGTRNISLVNRTDSTWGYWLIIIILFVAIIIVTVL